MGRGWNDDGVLVLWCGHLEAWESMDEIDLCADSAIGTKSETLQSVVKTEYAAYVVSMSSAT